MFWSPYYALEKECLPFCVCVCVCVTKSASMRNLCYVIYALAESVTRAFFCKLDHRKGCCGYKRTTRIFWWWWLWRWHRSVRFKLLLSFLCGEDFKGLKEKCKTKTLFFKHWGSISKQIVFFFDNRKNRLKQIFFRTNWAHSIQKMPQFCTEHN